MTNIWQLLPKPIFILAPMDDVTGTVFRQIIASQARPHLFFTEFINVDDIVNRYSDIPNKKMKFTQSEKPLIVQIWGSKPENFAKAANQIAQLGFDGIDINMGCPDRTVVRQGSGAGLIKNQPLAKEIIQAVKENANGLPVSVKTRIGVQTIQTEDWLGFLLDQNLDAITIHARTASELSKAPAHWEEFEKIVKLKTEKQKPTIIIGNGDIDSLSQAREKIEKYQIDGIMIGRGIFKNPWLFNEKIDYQTISPGQRMRILREHVRLFISNGGNDKQFPSLRKFFKIYISNFQSAKSLLIDLMETKNEQEVIQKLSKFNLSFFK